MTDDRTFKRRDVFRLAGGFAFTLGAHRLAVAAGPAERKLAVVILRGALDGLAAVPAFGEAQFKRLRGELAPPPPGAKGGSLPLDDGFALHPALKSLHGFYKAGEAAILHAAATPYRERSHFSGQDVLENGAASHAAARDGWLNRALQRSPVTRKAIAVEGAVPLILQGTVQVSSWTPSILPAADLDTAARLADLYADDPLLGPALAEASALGKTAEGMKPSGGSEGGKPPLAPYRALLEAGGRLLASDTAGVIALSLDGWDTHANQTGALAFRLQALDEGLAALRAALGAKWSETALLMITEFGRTVRINGTRGTDHGTGAAAFLLGGPVRGGRLLGDWPGLGDGDLHQGRDLAPANDLRALAKGLLRDHLGVARDDLDRSVFPGSMGVMPMEGLFSA